MSRKKKVIQVTTREEAEAAFGQFNRCTAELEALQGRLNSELTTAKEKYEAEIAQIQVEQDGHLTTIHRWAEANKQEFGEKRSVEFIHGLVGYRKGNHKVVTTIGFKLENVIAKLKKHLPQYIRKKEEIDKESLLAHRDDAAVKEHLQNCGLRVVQDETFYIEPKLETFS